MKAARVHLHIDRLVLHGVSHAQRDAVLRGLREELARVLADPDLLGTLRSRNVASARSGTLRPPENRAAGELGRQAARLLAQGIRD